MGGGGVCPDNAAPGNAAGAQCVGERGEGGEVGELQIRAPGNPYSSFSSSSLSLCDGGGSIKNSALGSAVHWVRCKRTLYALSIVNLKHGTRSAYTDIPVPVKRSTAT